MTPERLLAEERSVWRSDEVVRDDAAHDSWSWFADIHKHSEGSWITPVEKDLGLAYQDPAGSALDPVMDWRVEVS